MLTILKVTEELKIIMYVIFLHFEWELTEHLLFICCLVVNGLVLSCFACIIIHVEWEQNNNYGIDVALNIIHMKPFKALKLTQSLKHPLVTKTEGHTKQHTTKKCMKHTHPPR